MIAGGDIDSGFADFVTSSGPDLRRQAYALTGDWHLAEDLLQVALIRVHSRWHRIDPKGRFAYTRQVLVRAYLDRRRRRSTSEQPSDLLNDRAEPHDAMDEAVSRDVVRDAMRQLPPRVRAVLVCRFLEDLDVSTTAWVLGISVGTVKSQTARGLQALREPLTKALAVQDRN